MDPFLDVKLLKGLNCINAAISANTQAVIDAIAALPDLIAAAVGSGGGAIFAEVEVSAPGYVLSVPGGGPYDDGQQYVWRIVNTTGETDIALGIGFTLPADATNPLPFSTTAGLYDYLSARWNAGDSAWDIVTFIPGYPVTPI